MVNIPLASTTRLAPGNLAPGRRVYAVGDVHGCAGRLRALHRLIARDLEAHPVAQPLLLHVGDYIDRGPASARVIDMLCDGPPLPGIPTVNLMGNHEFMLLSALAQPGTPLVDTWLSNGGKRSLRSWGIKAGAPPDEWPALIPKRHLIFLRDLEVQHRLDGYLFVHAGVRPGIPLRQQSRFDLLWIREPFLSWRSPLLPDAPGLAVVHGHTPDAAPVIRPHRIGIDTGAVTGGQLSCAVLEANEMRVLSV